MCRANAQVRPYGIAVISGSVTEQSQSMTRNDTKFEIYLSFRHF